MKNLWILTEERPKISTLKTILSYFAKDNKYGYFIQDLIVIPLLNNDKSFNFTYELIGFKCALVDKVYIKIVSGYSSFVDYLIFYQISMPQANDIPLYAIEETKTDDSESRNTGVYQRCSKFVYIKSYYPNIKLVMLYSLKIKQKEISTKTYIFGTKLLKTYGVEILGKNLDNSLYTPFTTIKELISFKNAMPYPHSNKNIPIRIKEKNNKICVSGRLYKNGSLSHDPNIGALSIICAVIRQLGYNKELEITNHGLKIENIKSNNKFIRIANILNIHLENLVIPKSSNLLDYWKYETKGEKLATIFIHIVVENFTQGYSIFENHAGCEKGYFVTHAGEYIALKKYTDRDKYKKGDKSKIMHIPDLVLIDIDNSEAINIEGKTYINIEKGLKELNNYHSFEKEYLLKYYNKFKIVRTLVVYGSNKETIAEIQVGFLLNENGKMILGIKPPKLFKKAIVNLLDYWGNK